MGEMNFLLGGYKGKLGTTYGVRQNRKEIVKAVPFSHTPHNAIQKQNFSRFGIIQRIASPLAKNYWPQLHLNSKTVNRQNATAHWLKDLMTAHGDLLPYLKNVIAETNIQQVSNAEFLADRQSIVFDVDNTLIKDKNYNQPAIYIAYRENGKCGGFVVTEQSAGKIAIPIKNTEWGLYYIYEFTNIWEGKRNIISNASYTLCPYMPFYEETFYTDPLLNGKWFFEDPETLTEENAVCHWEGECLVALDL